MRSILLFFLSLLFSSQFLYAQEYRYMRYDVNNGLAGSTVYCMLQDKQGFMWFGTETGISRFDGTHFKNFGTAEGLPDNEILEMFLDSKGRIWMAPFKKTICYYLNGKIYNSDNDSLLRMIKLKNHVLKFAEDKNGDILIMESTQLHLIHGQKVSVFDSINGEAIRACTAISGKAGGGFLVLKENNLYELVNRKFRFQRSFKIPYLNFYFVALSPNSLVARSSESFNTIHGFQNDLEVTIPFSSDMLTMQLLGDSVTALNKHTGCFLYSSETGKPLAQFMHNKTVSKTFIDNEGNYWFSTIGEGVFRLASENMINVELVNESGRKLNANVVTINPGRWAIGTSMMRVLEIEYDSPHSIRITVVWTEFKSQAHSRVTALEKLSDGSYIYGTDEMLDVIPAPANNGKRLRGTSIKSIHRKSDHEFIVATRLNVLTVTVPDLKIVDTLWNERASAAYIKGDTLYVGTLDGLIIVLKDKSALYPGKEEPLLRNRINAIVGSPDGFLWIATNGAGVLGYRNGKIERRISINEGLSSNICRTICVNQNELWVGTDKGLNRVILQPNGTRIIKFTIGDGLSSNIINSVGIDGNMVVVATPEGVTFFDANRISFESHCSLVLDNIIVSGEYLNPSSESFSLPHRDNNIKFEFAGISFRSGGEMIYEYRLLGLDTTWKTSKENFLDYPTLPSGDYQLQLQAVNKFGIKSEVITVPFVIEKLLTEQTWFRLLVVFALTVTLIVFVAWLLRRVRRKETEKSDIQKRIAELEQLALKSQMNPHFIFNCLNSIQQFVLDKDIAGSNRFITGFSRLIRQTLDISAKKEISLSEEILYLSTYLELEKNRFEDKFTFEVRTGDEIDPDQFYLPPMMLQPFVENSIRHGIRYRTDNLGKILVSFNIWGQDLVSVVEDNGIGRMAALRHKGNNPIEYQSKGMSLIASRVDFLNRHSNHPITITIEDLENNQKSATGTRVVMKFPLENGPNNTNHA